MDRFQNSKIFVLDSWPLIEWAQQHQPTASYVDSLLEAAFRQNVSLVISRINYGEIIYNCKKHLGAEYASTRADIEALPIDVVSADDTLVDHAVDLKSVYPIAYADCFAAALAIRYQVPVVTGDRDFFLLQRDGLLVVEWVGA